MQKLINEAIENLQNFLNGPTTKLDWLVPLFLCAPNLIPAINENLMNTTEFVLLKNQLESITKTSWELKLIDSMAVASSSEVEGAENVLCLVKLNQNGGN